MLVFNHDQYPTTTTIIPRAHEDDDPRAQTIARFEATRPDPGPNPPRESHLPGVPPSSAFRAPSSALPPQSAIANPQSEISPLPPSLLIDYLAGYTAARLCASYNITLPQLFAWRSSPEIRQLLKEHKEFAAEQARHVQADKEPEIILTLCAIATRGTSESECRRAASDLLRAFKFRDYLLARRERESRSDSNEPRAPEPDTPEPPPRSERGKGVGDFAHSANDVQSVPIPETLRRGLGKGDSAPEPATTATTPKSLAAHPPSYFSSPFAKGGGVIAQRMRSDDGGGSETSHATRTVSINTPSDPFGPLAPSNPQRDRQTLRLADSEPQVPSAQCQVPSASSSQLPSAQCQVPFPRNLDTLTPRHLSLLVPDAKCQVPVRDKHNLREAILSHQEMLARSGAQILVDRHHFSPDQQSHEAYTAAVEFYKELARTHPAPDH